MSLPCTPRYSPAPIGLADYGLSANPNGNGSIVPSILNTSSLLATFNPNSTGVLGSTAFSSSPDAYGVQLNAVSTSINLLGNNSYSFWTQNVAEFYPLTGQLYLVTNVWNFTGGPISANALVAHGPYGVFIPGELYYSEIELTGVSYPFNLSLWMNNSVNDSRNMVNFTVALTDPGSPGNTGVYAYDYVVFNSTAATPSNYTANGFAYNAIGLTNDFEVILGGPGGGANSDLFDSDANLSLQYWNTTENSYEEVPSAFSYGGETGETVTGANVAWETNSTGSPYGLVTTGPAILEGLWNATGAQGVESVTFAVTPSNAFYFIGPNWTSNFTYQGDPYWAPQELNGGVFWLAPGNYSLSIILSDYTAVYTWFNNSAGPVTITLSLTHDTSLGIYTPLFFWSNSQFAALSTSGSGSTSSPYQIVNSQKYAFPSVFGLFNDYTFPVFTGVFIWGTTDSVVLNDMPALTTDSPYINFPATNDLGYIFYFASNIALVNSTHISGWFTTNVYDGFGSGFTGNYYGTFGVLEWNSSNMLIAGNTFDVQSGGLSMANGYDNTVWGNTFVDVPEPAFALCASPYYICPLNLSLGLQIAEGLGLVYNNAFYTNNTAVAPPFNLYSGVVTFWTDTWNITPTPASTVNYAAGWPNFPLTGTIIGNATQGGNYWWDYGTSNNPIGLYPYDEYNGYTGQTEIYDGGDYYPLIGYAVVFTESGLTAGTSWSATIGGGTFSSTTTSITVLFVNGSYPYTIGAVTGYTPAPASGSATVNGVLVPIGITFTATGPTTYSVTFMESGLTSGTMWSVALNGGTPVTSTTDTVVFTEPNGAYTFSVGSVSGYDTPNPSTGSVTVSGASPSTTMITFTPTTAPTYSVTFTETGLAALTNWSVTLNSALKYSTTGTIVFTEPNGNYTYTVGTVTGYTVNNTGGGVTVASANAAVFLGFTLTAPATYSVTFTESGLPSGTSWSVTLGTTTTPSTGTTITFTGLANAKYAYTIGAVSGYTSVPSSSSVTVNGASQTVQVAFSATSTSTSSSGLSALDWGIIGAVIAIIIIALIVGLAMRGRSGGGGSNNPPNSSDPQTGDDTYTDDRTSGGGSA